MPASSASERCPSCGRELPGQAAFCPSCGSATPTGVHGEGAGSVPPPDSPSQSATRERLASALGQDYQLGDLLGRGGFADVYAAFDRRLKRRVAVKVLREELRGDRAVQERFRREAEAMAQLRHPHIVAIYSVGEDQGLAYFVMPLLEGQTLAAALERESRWSFPEVCRIMREAASALSEAHRGGLIHRDVKPENIMLDGPDRRVVIMDFGIAKAVDEKASGLTATGMLVGSPQFMSPEQAAGDAVDALSDQYSLALVGYRMLAGRLPFQADSVRALLYKQATEQPPAVEEVRPDIPASLNAVIMRGLSKERSQRFPTIGEFESALTKVASEVAGDFRRQRPVPPLHERWTAALAELYDRPWRYAAAAIVGLLLFCLAYPLGESRAARAAVGARDGNLAAARLALDAIGTTKDHESIYHTTGSRLHRYLQEALGPLAADSAAAATGVWGWEVTRSRNQPYEYAWATFVANGRLQGVNAYVADSVARTSISADSASVLATAFVRRAGYDPSVLGSARRSQRDLTARRDHEFLWRLPVTFPRRGQDSVSGTLTVAVTGDRVTGLYRGLSVPPPATWELSTPAMSVVGGLAGGVMLVLIFVALGIAAKRAAFDTIQWGTTFRLALLCLIATTVAWILPSTPSLSTPILSADNVATIADHLVYRFASPPVIGPALMLLVLLAAAESLLNESRPELFAGLADSSRLRLRTPEVLQALPAGLALGVCLAAGRAIASTAGTLLAHLPVSPQTAIPDVALTARWPAIGVLSEVGITAMAVALLAFLVAASIRFRRVWLAPLGAALLWTGLTVTMRGPDVMAWEAALDGVVVGLAAVVVLRHGLLAGALALYLSTWIPVVYDLFWAGGPFRAAGIEGLLVLLLPAALGVVIYRQRPRSLPAASSPLAR